MRDHHWGSKTVWVGVIRSVFHVESGDPIWLSISTLLLYIPSPIQLSQILVRLMSATDYHPHGKITLHRRKDLYIQLKFLIQTETTNKSLYRGRTYKNRRENKRNKRESCPGVKEAKWNLIYYLYISKLICSPKCWKCSI